MSISVFAQNLSSKNNCNNSNKIFIADFSKASVNQKQIVIKLPSKANQKRERNYKVELIAGKTMMVDCNHHGLNGNIEEKIVEGQGTKYYVFTTSSEIWATRMGCPENSEHKEFVTAKPIMIEDDYQVPVVVYVPKGYDVK